MTSNPRNLPSRKVSLADVKIQSAQLTIDMVQWFYARSIIQTRNQQETFLDEIANDIPDIFKRTSLEESNEDGLALLNNITIWFNNSPTSRATDKTWSEMRQNRFKDSTTTKETIGGVYSKWQENRELDNIELVTLLDDIRDAMHRAKSLRDNWLLHNELMALEIEGETYMSNDPEWSEENMDMFSNQIRKVVEDLDLQRNLGSRPERQINMRRLLRMAGLRPIINNARIVTRPTPILDRVK